MSRRMLATCIVAVAALASSSQAAGPRVPAASIERWLTLDGVRDVGHIDWTCSSGDARLRFVNRGPSSRVRVFVGSAQLRIKALLQPRAAIEMPLGRRVQRWRVRPISESLPAPVTFRVHPLKAACARPVVFHDRDVRQTGADASVGSR